MIAKAAPAPSIGHAPAIRHRFSDLAIETGREPQRARERLQELPFASRGRTGAQRSIQMKRNRADIRHGDVEAFPDRARAKLHEAWKVPKGYVGDPIAGLPRGVLGVEDPLPVNDRLAKLPQAYRAHPDVKRLLEEQDAAHEKVQKVTSDSKARAVGGVTGGRVREVLAAIEYARQQEIPASQIRSARNYDFDVGSHKIDPFETPHRPSRADNVPLDYKAYLKGAYAKHTRDGKGGAKGVLDTTYAHPQEVGRILAERDRLKGNGELDSTHEPAQVRVPLEQEYLKDVLTNDRRYQSLLHHRGSDPTRKFGPSDSSRSARNKAKYNKAKDAKDAARMRKKEAR